MYILFICIVFSIPQLSGQNMSKVEQATFAGGCFWCTEAVFERIDGVDEVHSGYTGGTTQNPSYAEVCSGNTGHAEAIQITFRPDVVSYEALLEVFFSTHDPTTLNQQGNDKGTQYRSAIFYHNEAQKQVAERYIDQLTKEKAFEDPIVTELNALEIFYKAEPHHQDYFASNPQQPYCQYVIAPKVNKLKKAFKYRLKLDHKE